MKEDSKTKISDFINHYLSEPKNAFQARLKNALSFEFDGNDFIEDLSKLRLSKCRNVGKKTMNEFYDLMYIHGENKPIKKEDSRLELSEQEIKDNLNYKLKVLVKHFIFESKSLDDNQQQLLIEELGDNWSEFFDVSSFIRESAEQIYRELYLNRSDMQKLWEDVVVQAAKHSDKPEEIADNVVKRNNEQFTTSYSECKWVLK